MAALSRVEPRVAAGPAAHTTPAPQARGDGTSVSIPSRYLEPDKSGLTYTVRAGKETHDNALQP